MTATRVVGALVLLKAVDVALRGPVGLPAPVWAAALTVWVIAGIALTTGLLPPRLAWTGVLVAGVGIAVDLPLELRRQHLVLLMGVALAAAVARDDGERLLLWRTQLTVLYGVAALAKLNESFLGGDVLALAVATGPLASLPSPSSTLLVLTGAGLLLAEAGLATMLWLPRLGRTGVLLAAGLHGTALLVASSGPLVGLRLVVFGGTAVAVYAACAASPASGGTDRGVPQVDDGRRGRHRQAALGEGPDELLAKD